MRFSAQIFSLVLVLLAKFTLAFGGTLVDYKVSENNFSNARHHFSLYSADIFTADENDGNEQSDNDDNDHQLEGCGHFNSLLISSLFESAQAVHFQFANSHPENLFLLYRNLRN